MEDLNKLKETITTIENDLNKIDELLNKLLEIEI